MTRERPSPIKSARTLADIMPGADIFFGCRPAGLWNLDGQRYGADTDHLALESDD